MGSIYQNLTESATSREVDKPQRFQIPEKNKITKELPFWRYEGIIAVVVSMIAIGLILAEGLGLTDGTTQTAVFALLALFWGMFFVKWVFLMPRGNKVLILRARKSGILALTAEKVPADGKIHFDKKDDIDPITVGDINKHREKSTGVPVIVAVEGKPNNVSIVQTEEGKTQDVRELNKIVKTSYVTGYQAGMNEMLKFNQPSKDMILFGGLGLIIVVLVALTYLSYGQSIEVYELLKLMAQKAGVPT